MFLSAQKTEAHESTGQSSPSHPTSYSFSEIGSNAK